MFQPNDRVEFSTDLWIEPFVEIALGETGRIEAACANGDVWVKLDREYDVLKSWQNCVYLPAHFAPAELLERVSARP